MQEPTTLTLRKWFKKGGHITKDGGIEPFKRINFQDGNWKQFE
jgi:hypothetical protein